MPARRRAITAARRGLPSAAPPRFPRRCPSAFPADRSGIRAPPHSGTAFADRALRGHLNTILILETKSGGLLGTHMDMAQRADDAGFECHGSAGTLEHDTRSAREISGLAHRRVDPEREGIGSGQFHLIDRSWRSDDAHVRYPSVRTDQGHGFFGGVLSGLHQVGMRVKPVFVAEQSLDDRFGEMDVAGGDGHGYPAYRRTGSGRGSPRCIVLRSACSPINRPLGA